MLYLFPFESTLTHFLLHGVFNQELNKLGVIYINLCVQISFKE